MITDYEHQLTAADGVVDTASQNLVPLAGQNIRPASGTPVYGTRPYIVGSKAGQGFGDIGVGEKLALLVRPTADYNTLTSMLIELVGCDNDTDPGSTTAGTNEVTLCSATLALAALEKADGWRKIGVATSGSRKKMYRVKCSTTGSTPTTGALVAVLVNGDDAVPNNTGRAM